MSFNLGDTVYSKQFGKGKVVIINPLSGYPIGVRFAGSFKRGDYTPDGWFYTDNSNITLNINKTKLINTRYNQLKEKYV